MSTPECPLGYSLVQSTCLSDCPNGTQVVQTEPQICVSTVPCQVGTTADVSGLACLKVAPIGVTSATGGSCTAGYTEWAEDTCYVNCTSYFLENGTDCRRRVVTRLSEDPWCNGVFIELSNGRCIVSWWKIGAFAVGVLVLILVLYILLSVAKRSKRTF